MLGIFFDALRLEYQKILYTDPNIGSIKTEKSRSINIPGSANENTFQIKDQHISKQKELLEQAFRQWKGDYEQLDDICIIGVKI